MKGWTMVFIVTIIYALTFLLFDPQIVGVGLVGIWTGAIAKALNW